MLAVVYTLYCKTVHDFIVKLNTQDRKTGTIFLSWNRFGISMY